MVVLLYCPLKGSDVTFNRLREGRWHPSLRSDRLQEVRSTKNEWDAQNAI